MSDTIPSGRPPSWKWLVCGLLLLATMLNYMDRLTLNSLSNRIMTDLKLDEQEYGRVESAFGLAFAVGALFFGWLVDRVNVRWVYPGVVLLWSLAGFATGFAQGFVTLLLCRIWLGLVEAGNWPCALRTTQRILPPAERTMGNSLLQSGAAFGAILTPLIILGLLRLHPSWRPPFWAIGLLGTFWVVLWLKFVKSSDLALPPRPPAPPGAGFFDGDRPSTVQVRRFLVLVALVVCINLAWHFFRVWLPLFLQRQHGYSEEETQWFLSAYYIAADVGTLSAGALTVVLTRHGVALHRSRLLVFILYAALAALSVLAAHQPRGPLLLVLMLAIGFGSLGVFPVYYSLSQELTTRHQGKVTGSLGFSCWVAMAILHEVVGTHVKATKSYEQGVALAGLAPLAGFVVVLLCWGRSETPSRSETGARSGGERGQ